MKKAKRGRRPRESRGGREGAETRRRLVHMAVGLGAFLVKFLPHGGLVVLALAGVLFNKYVLPRVTPSLVRPGRGGATGLLAYPLTVLFLSIFFPPYVVAAGWGALALGDGLAGFAHAKVSLGPLPWNPRKSWGGFILCAVAGGYGAAGLALWTNPGAPLPWRILPLIVGFAVAFSESAPVNLDDNVRVGLTGALTVLALSWTGQVAWPQASQVLAGSLLTSLFALIAWRMKTITGSGALAGALMGALIWAFGSWKSFCLLALFFVLGSVATRVGYAVKRSRGLAQEKKGARGVRHVLANGLVPSVCAVLMTTTNEPGSWLNLGPSMAAMGLAGSLAAATADTLGSEIGQIFRGRVWIFATLRRGAQGAQGGISFPGSVATFLGAMAVGLAAWALHFFPILEGPDLLWAGGWVAASGVVGAYLDSFLGAYLEDKGFMGNEEVNLACTLAGASFVPLLSLIS